MEPLSQKGIKKGAFGPLFSEGLIGFYFGIQTSTYIY